MFSVTSNRLKNIFVLNDSFVRYGLMMAAAEGEMLLLHTRLWMDVRMLKDYLRLMRAFMTNCNVYDF